MPTVVFGLNGAKSTGSGPKTTPVKRKAVFDAEELVSDDESPAFAKLVSSKKSSRPLKTNPLNPLATAPTAAITSTDDTLDEPDATRHTKSPKLSHRASSEKYSNLSALRNARIQESKVAGVDSSVYDYDSAYDTFSSAAKQTAAAKNGTESAAAAAGPKYMNNLLASSEQRKRDQLRAREKALQREQEQEGDEFAHKDKFVTSAYKKQQEEMRLQEEDEQRRLKDEELRRAKGEGMLGFRKSLLRRDEERQKAIEEAARQKAERAAAGSGEAEQASKDGESQNDDADENKLAKHMNEKGAHIVVNDDGEVVDKRQLLSAGLNIAPKHHAHNTAAAAGQTMASRAALGASSRLSHARNAREAQRERQTRMVEEQLEEMADKAEQAAKAEEKELQEKNKSKITDEAKMDAKARYLARKKEREEAAAVEAAKKKNATTT